MFPTRSDVRVEHSLKLPDEFTVVFSQQDKRPETGAQWGKANCVPQKYVVLWISWWCLALWDEKLHLTYVIGIL
jgi:hypothetical protein